MSPDFEINEINAKSSFPHHLEIKPVEVAGKLFLCITSNLGKYRETLWEHQGNMSQSVKQKDLKASPMPRPPLLGLFFLFAVFRASLLKFVLFRWCLDAFSFVSL